tara:strand:- start:24250 stop:24408 length:159 start_codon:yes stop_codon:yes gene_type:complete
MAALKSQGRAACFECGKLLGNFTTGRTLIRAKFADRLAIRLGTDRGLLQLSR